MKGKVIFLELLWRFARFLIYIKRAVFFCISTGSKILTKMRSAYKNSIGFLIFKILFYFRKRFFPDSYRKKIPRWYWFGERWLLQIIAIIAAFFFIIPQTKLVHPVFGEVPGKKTILFALVGPGDQDFSLSDGLVEETGINNVILPEESWRSGSVSVEVESETNPYIFDDYYSTVVTGAVVKPAYVSQPPVIPGTAGGSVLSQGRRTTVVQYVIQKGDTVEQIAKQYGLKIETILTTNNLTTRSIIRPGISIKIPPADGILYTIARGDTAGVLSKRYGVSINDILTFNNLDEKGLQVGKQILIPGAKFIVTKSATQKQAQQKIKVPVSITPPVLGGAYIWPTGARVITQYYGLRHTGVDIAGPVGVPNYAVRDGLVIKSQCGWNGGYGCYIIIDHNNGVQTLYAHNSQLLVSPGDYVAQGQVIGLVGSTGRSTGPHLHFEIRISGRRTNPLQYVRR